MKQMELLAPAGNAAAALAAFDAGADAVYAGLARFNARERSENFTPDTMARIVEYAHANGRKVYVTVNTVVKESELPDVAEYLALLAEIGPDALIVQDLGVLRMVRQCFPQLVIHGSTQMGFHNSAGLKIAAELGIRRVILERQVPFDELRAMRAAAPGMELEMFVHGALCCSLSGQCLFSSWHGGASGNRGRCKQPCRRRFFSRDGNGFFFSPQDLCMIDQLDEIAELGVASLKIEGRLRQPDYVRNVVSAYRMMLDAAPGEERRERLGEARNLLARTCGRRWSHGFYSAESTRTLISHDSIGAAGLLCGKVEEVRDNGFGFTTARKLHVGDRIRLQPASGDEGPAFTITRMFVRNRSETKAYPGETVFICCDKETPPRAMVFKIGESYEDYSGRIAALPAPRKALDLEIDCTESALKVRVVNAPVADWSQVWSLAAADRHALDEATLTEVFRAADSKVFRAGNIRCTIHGRWFCPAAELKRVRRAFWDFIKTELQPQAVFSDAAVGLERFRRLYQSITPVRVEPGSCPETVAVKPNGEQPGNRRAIRAVSVYDVGKLATEAILPEFCPEQKLDSLKKVIRIAYEQGLRRFRTPALFGLELLKPYRDVEITAGGALPICNSMAVAELAEHGVSKVQGHVELEKDALLALAAHSPLPVEQYRFGRPVLLVTRAKIPVEGLFRDARGNEYMARYDRLSGLTRIYPRRIVSVPRLPGMLDFYDITNANWDARDTATFNFETGLL